MTNDAPGGRGPESPGGSGSGGRTELHTRLQSGPGSLSEVLAALAAPVASVGSSSAVTPGALARNLVFVVVLGVIALAVLALRHWGWARTLRRRR